MMCRTSAQRVSEGARPLLTVARIQSRLMRISPWLRDKSQALDPPDGTQQASAQRSRATERRGESTTAHAPALQRIVDDRVYHVAVAPELHALGERPCDELIARGGPLRAAWHGA